MRKTAGSRFRRWTQEVWAQGGSSCCKGTDQCLPVGGMLACMHACMHAGSRARAASSDPRSRGVGGLGGIGGWRWWRWWRLRRTSVGGSRHAVLPVGVPVCADTRTPHTACACVPMYGVRDAHGDGARRAELGAGDDSRDTARGAYARLAVFGGFALRIAHAACTPGYGCVSFRSHSL